MTDREKLIELLWEYDQLRMIRMGIEECVDKLIAKGVRLETKQATEKTSEENKRWIPVTERLPEEDGSYLVTTTTGAVTTSRFYVSKTYPPTHYRPCEYTRPTKWQSNRNVTHWIPLPEPPEEA